MDITNTNTNNNTTVKTPEAESETPTRIQLQPVTTKTPPFTNGVLKRHPPLNLHHHYNHHPPHHPPVVLAYRECLKNHAATLGGHALDGCGEFMPSSASIPADPTSLKCAACGCHRNFHRREPDDTLNHQLITTAAPALDFLPHHRHHPPPPRGGNGNNSNSSPNNSSSPSPPPISSAYYPASAPHMLLALSHPAPQSEGNNHHSPVPNFSRKRFRTKFTQNQKEKMLEFADKVGWKMLKKDEDSIGEFCAEIGVDKGVFKVWMHNNKNTFGKKDLIFTAEGGGSGSGGVLAIATPPAVVAGSSNGGGYNEVSDERKEVAVGSGNNRGDEKENGGGSSSRSSS